MRNFLLQGKVDFSGLIEKGKRTRDKFKRIHQAAPAWLFFLYKKEKKTIL